MSRASTDWGLDDRSHDSAGGLTQRFVFIIAALMPVTAAMLAMAIGVLSWYVLWLWFGQVFRITAPSTLSLRWLACVAAVMVIPVSQLLVPVIADFLGYSKILGAMVQSVESNRKMSALGSAARDRISPLMGPEEKIIVSFYEDDLVIGKDYGFSLFCLSAVLYGCLGAIVFFAGMSAMDPYWGRIVFPLTVVAGVFVLVWTLRWSTDLEPVCKLVLMAFPLMTVAVLWPISPAVFVASRAYLLIPLAVQVVAIILALPRSSGAQVVVTTRSWFRIPFLGKLLPWPRLGLGDPEGPLHPQSIDVVPMTTGGELWYLKGSKVPLGPLCPVGVSASGLAGKLETAGVSLEVNVGEYQVARARRRRRLGVAVALLFYVIIFAPPLHLVSSLAADFVVVLSDPHKLGSQDRVEVARALSNQHPLSMASRLLGAHSASLGGQLDSAEQFLRELRDLEARMRVWGDERDLPAMAGTAAIEQHIEVQRALARDTPVGWEPTGAALEPYRRAMYFLALRLFRENDWSKRMEHYNEARASLSDAMASERAAPVLPIVSGLLEWIAWRDWHHLRRPFVGPGHSFARATMEAVQELSDRNSRMLQAVNVDDSWQPALDRVASIEPFLTEEQIATILVIAYVDAKRAYGHVHWREAQDMMRPFIARLEEGPIVDRRLIRSLVVDPPTTASEFVERLNRKTEKLAAPDSWAALQEEKVPWSEGQGWFELVPEVPLSEAQEWLEALLSSLEIRKPAYILDHIGDDESFAVLRDAVVRRRGE